MLGSPSWQLSEDEGGMAHVLLYIRDVGRLAVPADLEAPPPLTGLPHHDPPALSDQARREAGREWASWWQDLLEVERRRQDRTADDEDSTSFRAWMGDLSRVFDAPDFVSLAGKDALREVAVALYPEAQRWVDAGPGRPSRLEDLNQHFPWAMVAATAERVADKRARSLGDVHGAVMVLDVEGIWWRRVAPGMVLCSTAAREDQRTAVMVLWDAFTSGLN
jgi:hypothetical protein